MFLRQKRCFSGKRGVSQAKEVFFRQKKVFLRQKRCFSGMSCAILPLCVSCVQRRIVDSSVMGSAVHVDVHGE